jgi:hypothetical protein
MKKALLALAALTLVLAVAGSVLGCNNGTTTSKKPGTSSSPGPSSGPDVKVEFPVIYKDGKFMDGASATTGEYTVDKDNPGSKTKGSVTLKGDYIEVKPAEGKGEYDDAATVGGFKLAIKFASNQDVSAYAGIKVVWEGVYDGDFNYFGINIDLQDPTGKTDKGGWDASNLALQVQYKASEATGGPSPSTAEISKPASWGMDANDFSGKIKEIDFVINTIKTGSDAGTMVPFDEWKEWKVKSVEFYK